MAILYHTAKFKSANSVQNVVRGKTAKFNDRQYVTLHEKTKHIALKMIFELRRPLPTATFELVSQQI